MSSGAFHKAFCKQSVDHGVDLDDLSFALIREGSTGRGLSDESFRDLLALFEMPTVLASSNFHSLTTAVWTDRDIFSAKQKKDMEHWLVQLYCPEIEDENSYSLCDMVVNVFDPDSARRILTAIGTQAPLREAAEYGLRQIDRKQL